VKKTLLFAILIVTLLSLAACNAQEARLPKLHSYNPGTAFTTNLNVDDIKRVVNCSIVFEVIDEAAVEEMTEYNFVVRDAVLKVLGSLTMNEVTQYRDLDAIALRIVEEVNAALGGRVDIVADAYFVTFQVT